MRFVAMPFGLKAFRDARGLNRGPLMRTAQSYGRRVRVLDGSQAALSQANVESLSKVLREVLSLLPLPSH